MLESSWCCVAVAAGVCRSRAHPGGPRGVLIRDENAVPGVADAEPALFAWVRGTFGGGPLSGREPSGWSSRSRPSAFACDGTGRAAAREARQRDEAGGGCTGRGAAIGATISCMEIGEFVGDAQLRGCATSCRTQVDRSRARAVQGAAGLVPVYLPPERTLRRRAAARAVARQGLRDLFVLRDEGPLRFALRLLLPRRVWRASRSRCWSAVASRARAWARVRPRLRSTAC